MGFPQDEPAHLMYVDHQGKGTGMYFQGNVAAKTHTEVIGKKQYILYTYHTHRLFHI